jgi:hypothetical protein
MSGNSASMTVVDPGHPLRLARAAVPATQLIGPQIDAVAKGAPRAALRTEMQK